MMLDVPNDHEDVVALVQSVRAVAHGADRVRRVVAAHYGLSVTELQTLAHLYPNASLRPGHLGGLLALTTGSITPLLDRLEAAGYLKRAPHPSDRRSLLVALTPEGEDVVAGSHQLVVQDMVRAVDGLRRDGSLDGIAVDRLADVLATLGGVLAAVDVTDALT